MLDIRDSSYYQLLLKEAIEEGRKEGMRRGRIQVIKQILFRQGRIRFGRLDKATRFVIEAIDDLKRVGRLSV
jgi:hypothetical protein